MTGDERHLDHEALRNDLAAHALGALPEEEAKRLEAHLESCLSCRELLGSLTQAVEMLPATGLRESPPARVRERLMAAVRAEAAAAGDLEIAGRAPTEPWWRRFAVLALRPATALGAAVVLAVGLAGGYLIRGDPGDSAGPSATFVAAEPLGSNQAISATLEVHGKSATLHVNELPRLAPDRVYEVWVERAGVIEPSTLFVLDREGSGTAAVPGPLEGADRVLVTEEPRGGSQRPTTPPLLAASLS